MTKLRLILGDQLNAAHPWFRRPDPEVILVMMEVRSETDYVVHHAQKVLAIFAAMRGFARALSAAGHRVHYLRIGDADNRQDFFANLDLLAARYQASSFERIEADEWRVERLLDEAAARLALPITVVDGAHFLCAREELAAAFAERVPRLEFFYRDMRRRHRILLDAQGKPVGGRWNFDAENRARWPGEPLAPPWPWAAADLSSLWGEIVAAGVRTLGAPNAEALAWPLSRAQARAGLEAFVAVSGGVNLRINGDKNRAAGGCKLALERVGQPEVQRGSERQLVVAVEPIRRCIHRPVDTVLVLDGYLIALPDLLAERIEELKDSEDLLVRPMIGKGGQGEHRDLKRCGG